MEKYFGLTDIGKKRENNEDAFSCIEINDEELLLTVCDGMGGAKAGQVASSLALESFTKAFVADYNSMQEKSGENIIALLKNSVESANNAVLAAANADPNFTGMGTTLVSAFLRKDGIYAVNVGDSRLYIYGGTLSQITHDHSYVQTLIDMGQLTEAEAENSPMKNLITKAIGIEEEVEPDIFTVSADEEKKYLLLCSDGLTNYAKTDCISKILADKRTSCKRKAELLIKKANEGGGGDNITAVVARW